MNLRNFIVLTDERGRPAQHEDQMNEPEPGSVVLSSGEWGTAWQRYFSDGLWHSVGTEGRGKAWDEMLRLRNLVLVYEARERFDFPLRQPDVQWRGAVRVPVTTWAPDGQSQITRY